MAREVESEVGIFPTLIGMSSGLVASVFVAENINKIDLTTIHIAGITLGGIAAVLVIKTFQYTRSKINNINLGINSKNFAFKN